MNPIISALLPGRLRQTLHLALCQNLRQTP
jgi:hypothetical protein